MRTAMANVFRTVGLITLLAGAGTAKAQINAGPYVPTPWPIVTEMMKLANLKSSDFIIDLGSGDGRLVITAAKQDSRAPIRRDCAIQPRACRDDLPWRSETKAGGMPAWAGK